MPKNNRNHTTTNQEFTNPCIVPKIKGVDAPNKDNGTLLLAQNNPRAKTMPKAENHNVYQA